MLSEANQDAAIEALRRERLRLVSVTPVRTSLEDYFLQKLQPANAPTAWEQKWGHGMTSRIAHIASNTFREAVRDRVLYNLIVFALLMSAAAVAGGPDLHRYRTPGGDQPRPDRGLAVRHGDRHLHRNWTGFERDREADALHRALAAGTALGIYCRQVFRTGGHAGGQHVLHGHRRVCSAALRFTPLPEAGWLGAGGAVFHHSAVSDYHGADFVLFFVLLAAAFRGICIFAVCDRAALPKTCADLPA